MPGVRPIIVPSNIVARRMEQLSNTTVKKSLIICPEQVPQSDIAGATHGGSCSGTINDLVGSNPRAKSSGTIHNVVQALRGDVVEPP